MTPRKVGLVILSTGISCVLCLLVLAWQARTDIKVTRAELDADKERVDAPADERKRKSYRWTSSASHPWGLIFLAVAAAAALLALIFLAPVHQHR